MPKCVIDGVLHQQVLVLVRQRGGSVAAAFTPLIIHRTKFWSLVKSGLALTKIRSEISERVTCHTATIAAQESAIKTQSYSQDLFHFSCEQAGQLRDFCRQMKCMISIYFEAAGLKKKCRRMFQFPPEEVGIGQ